MLWMLLGLTAAMLVALATRLVGQDEPSPPAGRRWTLGKRDSLRLLLMILALDFWAWWSTDSDFFLPDAFRPIVMGLVLFFIVTGWIGRPRLRAALRGTVLVLFSGLLILEAYGRFRPIAQGRMVHSDDVLLRFQYQPGFHSGEPPHDVHINSLGLWDYEHPIPKPAGVFRIAVLSSSVGNDFEIPEDQRFHSLLGEMLADAVPKGEKVEVINLSAEGYNAQRQERLLEKVGLRYEPDLVVEAFALSGAFLQSGSGRHIGNSYFAFRILPMLYHVFTGQSFCSFLRPTMFGTYGYNLVVQNAFERLNLLHQVHGFPVLVAVLPALVPFDDPDCVGIYDKVATTAEGAGLNVTRTYQRFHGESYRSYFKPGGMDDYTHVNVAGHRRFAEDIAHAVRQILATGIPRYH